MHNAGVVQFADSLLELSDVAIFWNRARRTLSFSKFIRTNSLIKCTSAAIIVDEVDIVGGFKHLDEAHEVSVAQPFQNVDCVQKNGTFVFNRVLKEVGWSVSNIADISDREKLTRFDVPSSVDLDYVNSIGTAVCVLADGLVQRIIVDDLGH